MNFNSIYFESHLRRIRFLWQKLDQWLWQGAGKATVLLALIFLMGGVAEATINPQTVEVINASAWSRPAPQATTPGTGVGGGQAGDFMIYGGIMGPACAPTVSGGTCSNCVGDNMPCNANRITPETLLTIRFRSDNASVITPTSKLFFVIDNRQVSPGPGTDTTFNLNGDITITIRWGDLCGAITSGDTGCNTAVSNKSIQFGISTTNDTTLDEAMTVSLSILGTASADPSSGYPAYQNVTLCPPGVSGVDHQGYCWLEIERGDEKVYINQEASTGELAPLDSKFSALRVFYASKTDGSSSISSVVSSASNYKDFGFTINSDAQTLNDNKISGLTNGTYYYFMFANVDVAGNVFYFSNPTQLDALTPASVRESFIAKPEEVSGALEGKECFIATAAYGTPMAPQLDILRAFRDQFLKTNAVGRWLVKKYYIYGPKWAQKIKKREAARATVRAALSPVVSMAQWLILYGLKSFILISLAGFVVGFLIIKRVIRDHD